ncbi:DNA polymerase I [uncultured Treponema sp.]|uniref:DNA polymerase I n=1 Tax=uncultured Treponema sp. TaxID=162155 RepID=UPI0025FA6C55|nr:DNA polymerase I [uncultured Treponema sp.]
MSDFINENTLFVLDSYGLIYREYFAFISRPLTNSKGENVSAVFGFFRNLLTILKNYSPKYMVAAMDSKTATFRHKMYAEYKATRPKTPEDLHAQIPMIEDILETLGIRVIRRDGYEADDVIATLAKKAESEGRNCVILSADKDLQQLTNAHIHCMKPDKAQIWAELDEAGVESAWGVPAAKLLDLLSLMGDTADNVPGVKGVGQKTAVKLLSEYGSLEGIYEHAGEIKGALGEKIRGDRENAFFSKKLITLCSDVPDLESINECCIESLNYAGAAEKMSALEIRAIARDYANQKSAHEFLDSNENFSAENSLFTQTPHPAGELSASKTSVKEDTEVHTPAVVQNKGNYRAITGEGELSSYIDKILSLENSLFAFDTETDSLDTSQANLLGFSLSYEKGSGVYVPIATDGGDLFAEKTGISKKNALEELRRIFYCPKCTIVLHNAKFDMKVLDAQGIIKIEDWTGKTDGSMGGASDTKASDTKASDGKTPDGDDTCKKTARIADTMIAAWLLEPDRSGKNAYSLEYLSETQLHLKGTEFGEIVGKGQTFADVPLETAAAYSSEDSDFTLQLWNLFEKRLDEENLAGLFWDMEMKVLPILAQMELNGIHVDSRYLNYYALELKRQISSIEQEIFSLAGHEFNIASPKQLGTVLFEEKKLPTGKKTRTGYSTDTSVLEELSELDPLPAKVLEYRAKAKLLSTYVETLPAQADSDGRVHTSFMQTGTATGRLSSKDPNLQNIPVRSEEGRRIRTAFTAEKGKILISADYAQIELVVLAHLSGDKNLCEAFKNNVDVHKSTASLIYNVPMNDVTPEMRRSAKTLNFGLMYGMGAFSLAKDLGIGRGQAKDFIDNYFAVYSGVKKFFDENVRHAEESGYIKTIFDRRRKILAINSRNKMEKEGAIRVAKNSPIQGSAADIVKKAMIDVSQALKATGSKARLLLQVHDELIFECDDDEKSVSDAIALIQDKMEHAVRLSVPLRVSIEHGKNWGEFH